MFSSTYNVPFSVFLIVGAPAVANTLKLPAFNEVASSYWFNATKPTLTLVSQAIVSFVLLNSIFLTTSSSALKVAVAVAILSAAIPPKVTV
ncbi:hypothetical protein D3C73_971990 [compost metagenome]